MEKGCRGRREVAGDGKAFRSSREAPSRMPCRTDVCCTKPQCTHAFTYTLTRVLAQRTRILLRVDTLYASTWIRIPDVMRIIYIRISSEHFRDRPNDFSERNERMIPNEKERRGNRQRTVYVEKVEKKGTGIDVSLKGFRFSTRAMFPRRFELSISASLAQVSKLFQEVACHCRECTCEISNFVRVVSYPARVSRPVRMPRARLKVNTARRLAVAVLTV